MKSINKSLPFYLDYNATAPWTHSVKEWLSSGAVPYGNPSSQHQLGKQSRRLIRETTDFLFEFFLISQDYFEIYYHSGASESINHIYKGAALSALEHKRPLQVIYFKTDHSCMVNQHKSLELLGVTVHELDVDTDGMPKNSDWIDRIALLKGNCLINLMWSHNETGVVWPVLEYCKKLKEKKSDLWIHIDGVQAPGKINCSLKDLQQYVDAVTYSGHKFGALKGVGMTFLRQTFPLRGIIEGGGQQKGRRSGTENVTGVYSLQLALKDMGSANPAYLEKVNESRHLFEKILIENLGQKIEIVGAKATRNSNTSSLIFPAAKSDTMLTALDLESLCVSSGSACSSGATIPNRVLMHMGRTKEQAMSSLRFSFSPELGPEMAKEIAQKSLKCFNRY